jgi:uncharacterized protein YycO
MEQPKQKIDKNVIQPQPGDFGVVKMGGTGGKWIHIGQFAAGVLAGNDESKDYEHAFVYVGGGQIVEAEPGGARQVLVHYDHILWSTGIIQLTLEQRMSIVEAAKKYVGTPYSAVDYFAIAAQRLHAGVLIPGLKTYVSSSKHMICSQLVDKCYQDAGVHLFDDKRWSGYVMPSSLAGLING